MNIVFLPSRTIIFKKRVLQTQCFRLQYPLKYFMQFPAQTPLL